MRRENETNDTNRNKNTAVQKDEDYRQVSTNQSTYHTQTHNCTQFILCATTRKPTRSLQRRDKIPLKTRVYALTACMETTSFTLLVQLESMERMLRHTLWIVSAGLHSSYKIDKQMCPFV